MTDIYTPTPKPNYTTEQKLAVSPFSLYQIPESDIEDMSGLVFATITYKGNPIVSLGEQSDIISRSHAFNISKNESIISVFEKHIPEFDSSLLKSEPITISNKGYSALIKKSESSNNIYHSVFWEGVSLTLIHDLMTNTSFSYCISNKYIDFDSILVPSLDVVVTGSMVYLDPYYINNITHHLTVDKDGLTLTQENGREVSFLKLNSPLPYQSSVIMKTNPHARSIPDFAEVFLSSDIQNKKIWEELEKERKRQLFIHESKIRHEKQQEEDDNFNKSLNIPFEYELGYKVVLSGLLDGSNCNGSSKKTVSHIILKEDYSEGRFKRVSGDFLCKAKDSKMWNEKSDGRVTCSQCLKIAKRWGA